MKFKTLLLLASSLSASNALAQSTDTVIDRTESRMDRVLDREPAAVRALDGSIKPWSFSLDVPITYNTNVANADSGTNSAFHANPSIALGREWSLGNVTLSFETGADSDLYTAHEENDSSSVYGEVRATLGKPEGSIAPYVDYTILGIFDGQFDDHAVTLHHFSVGATNVTQLSENASVSFDANVLRREASIKDVEQTRGSLSAKYKFRADDKTTWVVGLRGQIAEYTGGASDNRTDKSIRASLGVSQRLSDAIAVNLQAKFDRNWSDRPGKDYATWDFGPAIGFTTQF